MSENSPKNGLIGSPRIGSPPLWDGEPARRAKARSLAGSPSDIGTDGEPMANPWRTGEPMPPPPRADDDDRRRCIQCAHFKPWRCVAHMAAGLQSPDVGRDLAALPQRCDAWTPRERD